MTTTTSRHALAFPQSHRLLMHWCCAPCWGALMDASVGAHIADTLFFYNPNIQPLKEYALRKQEKIRVAVKHRVSFIDAGYDTGHWSARAMWHGAGARTWHPLHVVLHMRSGALRCTRTNTRSGDHQPPWELALEKLRLLAARQRPAPPNAGRERIKPACCSMASPPKVTDCVTIAVRQGAMSQRLERRTPGA